YVAPEDVAERIERIRPREAIARPKSPEATINDVGGEGVVEDRVRREDDAVRRGEGIDDEEDDDRRDEERELRGPDEGHEERRAHHRHVGQVEESRDPDDSGLELEEDGGQSDDPGQGDRKGHNVEERGPADTLGQRRNSSRSP